MQVLLNEQDRVSHHRFGEGVVVATDQNGCGADSCTIRFTDGKQVTFLQPEPLLQNLSEKPQKRWPPEEVNKARLRTLGWPTPVHTT